MDIRFNGTHLQYNGRFLLLVGKNNFSLMLNKGVIARNNLPGYSRLPKDTNATTEEYLKVQIMTKIHCKLKH